MTARTVEMSGDDTPLPNGRDTLSQRILRGVDLCYVRLFHRLSVHGPCTLPRRGPGIVICNHVSSLDPLLIQSVSPRLIRWMIAREYYEMRPMHWLFKLIDTIPVRRGLRELVPTRAALRTLETGHLLGVFPEGRIEETRQPLPFQTGVAMLAMKTGVSVYPMYLDGTMRGTSMVSAITHRQHASIHFGQPIQFQPCSPDRHDLEAATEKLAHAVNKFGGTRVTR